jgi:hypothetical protein
MKVKYNLRYTSYCFKIKYNNYFISDFTLPQESIDFP